MTVIDTVRSEEKFYIAMVSGVVNAINSHTEDIAERVAKFINKAGVDVVYSSIVKNVWETSIAVLCPTGYLVNYGHM